MKNLFKNYSFWVSLSGAVVVLIETIGRAVGFIADGKLINDIIMAVAGLLVVLGVVTMPANNKGTNDESDDEDDNNGKILGEEIPEELAKNEKNEEENTEEKNEKIEENIEEK